MKKAIDILLYSGAFLIIFSIAINYIFSLMQRGLHFLSNMEMISSLTSPISILGIILIVIASILFIVIKKK